MNNLDTGRALRLRRAADFVNWLIDRPHLKQPIGEKHHEDDALGVQIFDTCTQLLDWYTALDAVSLASTPCGDTVHLRLTGEFENWPIVVVLVADAIGPLAEYGGERRRGSTFEPIALSTVRRAAEAGA